MDEMILGSLNGSVRKSTAERVVRLDRNNSSSWAHFPRFIERSLIFAEKLVKYNSLQLKNLEQDLCNRWATTGGMLAIAILNEHDQMVGHVLGWVNVDYGQPYLFNFQAEMDDGFDMRPLLDQVLVEHLDYVKWANEMYEKGGQPVRITQVVTQTMRNADALVRYLKLGGAMAVAERTVIRWQL
jgi:hypothetical protein